MSITHGVVSAYRGSHRCRCEECRQANTEYQRAYMARHPEQREKAKHRERKRYERYRQGEYVPPRASW